MLHTVGVELGIGDLEVDDRVNLHGDIIFGDHRLGGKVRHLLLQAHLFGNALDKRHFQMQAYIPNGAERAQPFHHVGAGLLNNDDIADNQDQEQRNEDRNNDPLHNEYLHFYNGFQRAC